MLSVRIQKTQKVGKLKVRLGLAREELGKERDWGCSLAGKYLPGMYKALSRIPHTHTHTTQVAVWQEVQLNHS